MSSSATQSTQPRFVRSGELYFFPSFEDVYKTVSELTTRDNPAYICSYLRPSSYEKSAVYITGQLENPRSFVWVGKHEDSDDVSSGTCYKLDVHGPPSSAVPSADQLGMGLQPAFTESSIVQALNSLDDHCLMPNAGASPEMTMLWGNIKANQGSVATSIKHMATGATTNGEEPNNDADDNSTDAQSDESDTMSLATTIVG